MAIALVTCSKHPELPSDDRLLLDPLRTEGLEPKVVLWDDPAVDWRAFEAIVLRSPWDYYARFEEFTAWLARLEGLPLHNPLEVIRWNIHKRYLLELETRGAAIVPTELVERGSSRELDEVLRARGWTEAVVKPAVSAGGHETFVARDELEAALFAELVQHKDTLVQPLLREVMDEGEWSFLFFDGIFSHALLKRAAPGGDEFRVQAEHGGSIHAVSAPPAELLAQAERALRAAPFIEPLLYARVDGVVSGGRFLLMELELIEPSLYLAQDASSPARFARALAVRTRAR